MSPRPAAAATAPTVLHLRFHPSPGGPPDPVEHAALLRLVHEVTPVARALPPGEALADVRGALRYFGRDATGLAELLRVRALARYGTGCTVGVAANPLLAGLAAHFGHPGTAVGAPAGAVTRAADGSGGAGTTAGGEQPGADPGWVCTVPADPASVAAFLDGLPTAALPGVGTATARRLDGYGLDTVGRVAATPPETLQRILGAAPARRLHALAQGVDPSPVLPGAPPPTADAGHRFDRDELDPAAHRRALLALAEELGARLRDEHQVTGSLTLTVHYADRSATARTRPLDEPTAHSAALAAAAHRMHAALGLQRARVRAVALRADALAPAASATRQLSLDPGDDGRRAIEAVQDRVRAKYGPGALRPAALAALGPDRAA
jgi:DNA polymerase-4